MVDLSIVILNIYHKIQPKHNFSDNGASISVRREKNTGLLRSKLWETRSEGQVARRLGSVDDSPDWMEVI